MVNLFICALLISLCLCGICGLFFFREYIKKISSLSVSYTSFVILVMVMALRNSELNNILVVMVSILIIFATNLLIAIAIVKNISKQQSDDGK